MGSNKKHKVISILLLLALAVGLFPLLPMQSGSYADGTLGNSVTANFDWTVDVQSSEGGIKFNPLSDTEENALAQGEYLRFEYVVKKKAGSEIAVNDYFELPLSNVFQKLTEAELKDMEARLNKDKTNLVTSFDDYTNPTRLRVKLLKAYGASEETVFNIVATLQMYLADYKFEQPYELLLPLPNGSTLPYKARITLPSSMASAIAMQGARDPGPEIVWTIDVNRNLLSDQDVLIVRQKLDPALIVSGVKVQPIQQSIDADRKLVVDGYGADLTGAMGSESPTVGNFTYEVKGDELILRIANPKVNAYRNAFRVTVDTLQDPAKIDSSASSFSYNSEAKLVADESATDHLALTTAGVTFTTGQMLTKVFVSTEDKEYDMEISKNELTWKLTINPSRLAMKDAVLTDAIVSKHHPNNPMTFAVADFQLVVKSSAADAGTPVEVLGTNTPGKTWVELLEDGKKFKLHFADKDISNKMVELTVISRLVGDALKFMPSPNKEGYNDWRYHTDAVYENSATLDYTGKPAATEYVSTATRTVRHGFHVVKTISSETDYTNNYLWWRFMYNLTGTQTGVRELTDEIDPTNQSLILIDKSGVKTVDPKSVEVMFGVLQRNQHVPQSHEWKTTKTAVEGTDYNLVFDEAQPNKLKFVFTEEINQPIYIRIRTKIDPAVYSGTTTEKKDYINHVGIGTERYTFKHGFTVDNTYSKADQFWPAVKFTGEKLFYGAEEVEKTKRIPYALRVEPIRGAMNDLVITDELPQGMVITGADLQTMVTQGVGTGLWRLDPTFLQLGTDFEVWVRKVGASEYIKYETTSDANLKYNAFQVKYLKPVAGKPHRVHFFAHVDGTILTDKVINTATFHHAGLAKAIEKKVETPYVSPYIKQNARMIGEILPEQKKVEWQLDFNYLSGSVYNITVDGSVGDGQEIDENSFRIYTDTVDSTGKPDKTNADSTLIVPAAHGIEIEVTNKKSFKVQFHDGVNRNLIDKPIRIVYDGKMVGERLNQYDSKSTVNFEDHKGEKYNIPLKADVSKVENANTYVSKSGKAVENTDLIEWTITLNESYSDIGKLKVIDTFSPGLKLLKDTLKLYDDKGVLVAEGQEFFDNWFEFVEPNPGEDSTVFHLIFREGPGKMITKKMQIKYQMQLVESKLKSNTLTNQVTLEGALRKDAVKESQAQVVQRYYDISINEADVNRQMKIVKVNEKGEPMAGVEFRVELKRPDGVTVVGTFKTGADGTALVEKLRQNLTYDLVEVKAPEGYELAAPKQFTVNAANDVNKGGKPLEVKVVNQPKSEVPQPSVPVDPNQPTAPTDPAPSQPTDPTQPTTPTTPTQPTAPTEPTQPAPDATGGIGTEPTTTTEGDRTRGDLPIQPEDLVEVSTPPENGTVTIVDGGWEYIPLGVPTKDSFVVTIVRPDGSKETVEIDIVPENIPQGGLPITGQLPEWLFYVSGALVVLMGVAVRFFNRRA